MNNVMNISRDIHVANVVCNDNDAERFKHDMDRVYYNRIRNTAITTVGIVAAGFVIGCFAFGGSGGNNVNTDTSDEKDNKK